jgi:hypothetical protein
MSNRVRIAWEWLIEKPERLTALSTSAIFLATAVTVGVGFAQWRALISTDAATRMAAEAAQTAATANVDALEISRAQIRAFFNCMLEASLDKDRKEVVACTLTNTGQSQGGNVSVEIMFGYKDLIRGNIGTLKGPAARYVNNLSHDQSTTDTVIATEPLPEGVLGPSQNMIYHIGCIINFMDVARTVPQTPTFPGRP